MSEPREWFLSCAAWAPINRLIAFTPEEQQTGEGIHVIEMSAYLAIVKERDGLRELYKNKNEQIMRFSAQLDGAQAEVDRLQQYNDAAELDKLLTQAEQALESSNVTILHLMEEYARGNGLTIGRMTVDSNNETLSSIRGQRGKA